MATTAATVPVNGNHAPDNQTDLSKEEVGWYFVEQYYTTLSRDAQKLWLYYNKRSQHVSGVEEEKVPVCVGQKHIKDRISELNFSNSKVRITNVDAQSSDDNILIQVLGDIAFSDASPRHFVQSFVLSQQPNGYFVLNDIFRYIKEDEEEVVPDAEQESGTNLQEPVPTASGKTNFTNPEDSVTDEDQPAVVDEESKDVKADEAAEETPALAEVNGTPAEPATEEARDSPAPIEPESEIIPPAQDPAAEVVKEAAAAAEKAAHDEKPVEPTPDTTSNQKSAPPAPAAAPKPAIPKTWASMAASANSRVAMPALPTSQKTIPVAQPKSASSTSEPASKAQAPAPPTTAVAAPAIPSAPSPQPASSTPPAVREGSPDSAGWQSVGHDHSRKQSRVPGQPKQDETVRAYVKNVNTVTQEELSNSLSQFGQLDYVDVDTAKSCAFVTFHNLSGFNAAVRANPHHIGEDEIYVEERKTRPFVQNPGSRGSVRGRGGRGTFGGAERGGRGGFTPRGGRGGAPAGAPQRGRGGVSSS